MFDLATTVLDGSGARGFTAADAADYGCAGRGTFNPFSNTKGRQVDTADKAFYIWKKCVQCAVGNAFADTTSYHLTTSYSYDPENYSCGKSSDKTLKTFD